MIQVEFDKDLARYIINSRQFNRDALDAVADVFKSKEAAIQSDMQNQSFSVKHWEDHSGHARGGLEANTQINQFGDSDEVDLILSADVGAGKVQYNVFLEFMTSADGIEMAYATMIPTYDAYEKEIVDDVEYIFS